MRKLDRNLNFFQNRNDRYFYQMGVICIFRWETIPVQHYNPAEHPPKTFMYLSMGFTQFVTAYQLDNCWKLLTFEISSRFHTDDPVFKDMKAIMLAAAGNLVSLQKSFVDVLWTCECEGWKTDDLNERKQILSVPHRQLMHFIRWTVWKSFTLSNVILLPKTMNAPDTETACGMCSQIVAELSFS